MQELTQTKFKELLRDQSKIAFCFDYDGTLVELAEQNIVHAALFPQATAKLLNELATKAQVAIVTGRELKNLKALLDNQLDPVIRLYGTHGAEMNEESHDNQYTKHIAKIRTQFENELGIEFEQKRISITFHYLNHPNKAELLIRLNQLAHDYKEIFRIQEGRDFFEFLPKHVNKGIAIEDMRRRYLEHHLVYFGDDLTDTYAFKVINSHNGLSCQVSQRIKSSQAGYLIYKVSDLHGLIQCYLDL